MQQHPRISPYKEEQMPINNLSVVIQAGGKSSRMGTDKGLVEFRGVPLIKFILDQINRFGQETMIVTNDPGKYLKFGIPVYCDVLPNMGSLGGIYSALFHSSYENILILACDMPFLDLNFFTSLVEYLPNYDAVVPFQTKKKFAEPFRSIYTKRTLPIIEQMLINDELKINDLFSKIKTKYVDISTLDLEEESILINLNEPADLVRAHFLPKDEVH